MKMEYGLNTSPTAHEGSLMFIKRLELKSTEYYRLFINSCCLAPSHSFHMSKKGILQVAEPAKPVTASALPSALPPCTSLPAPPSPDLHGTFTSSILSSLLLPVWSRTPSQGLHAEAS